MTCVSAIFARGHVTDLLRYVFLLECTDFEKVEKVVWPWRPQKGPRDFFQKFHFWNQCLPTKKMRYVTAFLLKFPLNFPQRRCGGCDSTVQFRANKPTEQDFPWIKNKRVVLLLDTLECRVKKGKKNEIITSRFSILHFMSRASVKNASSTLMEAFAEVSMNFMPYSIASSSPRSLETWT